MPATASARRRAAALPLALVATVVALTVGVDASPASAAVTSYTNTTSVAIPDSTSGTCWSTSGMGVATSTITVGDAGSINDVRVALNIAHSFRGDLVVDLTSPQGSTVRLLQQIGAPTCGDSGVNLSALFSDTGSTSIQSGYAGSGTYRPAQPLSAFRGEEAAGVWTLTVLDTSSGDTGSLTSWGLTVDTGAHFSVSDASTTEDGIAAFTVTRTGDLTGTDTVDFATVPGTATAGADYWVSSGRLTFPPGGHLHARRRDPRGRLRRGARRDLRHPVEQPGRHPAPHDRRRERDDDDPGRRRRDPRLRGLCRGGLDRGELRVDDFHGDADAVDAAHRQRRLTRPCRERPSPARTSSPHPAPWSSRRARPPRPCRSASSTTSWTRVTRRSSCG